MVGLLAKILHVILQNPAVATVTAAIVTGIAMWLSRPKPANELAESRVKIMRLTETVETTVRTTRTVEVEQTTVGKP